MKRLVFGFLVACGMVSVSFGAKYPEWFYYDIDYAKEKLAYMEWLKKEGVFPESHFGYEFGEFKKFVELAEAVEKDNTHYSDDVGENCVRAMAKYIREKWDNNRPAIVANKTCMEIPYTFKSKKFWEKLDILVGDAKARHDAFIRQKANVMSKGVDKDGVTEVGTLSDGTKVEIVKETKKEAK